MLSAKVGWSINFIAKYTNNHKYENGTSFKLDQILDTIYKKNTPEELLKDLEKKLSNNFEFVIKKKC